MDYHEKNIKDWRQAQMAYSRKILNILFKELMKFNIVIDNAHVYFKDSETLEIIKFDIKKVYQGQEAISFMEKVSTDVANFMKKQAVSNVKEEKTELLEYIENNGTERKKRD